MCGYWARLSFLYLYILSLGVIPLELKSSPPFSDSTVIARGDKRHGKAHPYNPSRLKHIHGHGFWKNRPYSLSDSRPYYYFEGFYPYYYYYGYPQDYYYFNPYYYWNGYILDFGNNE